MTDWRATVAVVAAATILVTAGCTASDVESMVPGESANFTASVDGCSTGGGVETCTVETSNRVGSAASVEVELEVVRGGAVVYSETAEETITPGRDVVQFRFPEQEGEKRVAIRRAEDGP